MDVYITLPILRKLATKHDAVHKQVAQRLRKKSPPDLDAVVREWTDELFGLIPCLECGHCCAALGPRITPSDIGRVRRALSMKEEPFVAKYLRVDEDGDYVFQAMPCPFLGEDNHCFVYEERPRACRDYPHTESKKFHKRLMLSLKNRSTCPIVFHIFQRLVTRYGLWCTSP